jgi:hypothetical protein
MFRENVTMREEQYHLTQKEMIKLQVISKALEERLTVKEAAAALRLSERQVKRLKKGVAAEGPSFLIHKNRDRLPANAITADTKATIINLKETKYKKANFSHFTELLAEYENVLASRASIQRILNSAGIKSPKKHRKTKKYQRRKRKAQAGLLVQLDASPFAWLGGDERYSLHGAIDDATGMLLGLYLTKNECLNGYFALMKQVFTAYGIPAQLYSDRHTIFFVSKKKPLSLDEQLAGKTEQLTQFGRPRGVLNGCGKLCRAVLRWSSSWPVSILLKRPIYSLLIIVFASISALRLNRPALILLLVLWIKGLILITSSVSRKSVSLMAIIVSLFRGVLIRLTPRALLRRPGPRLQSSTAQNQGSWPITRGRFIQHYLFALQPLNRLNLKKLLLKQSWLRSQLPIIHGKTLTGSSSMNSLTAKSLKHFLILLWPGSSNIKGG